MQLCCSSGNGKQSGCTQDLRILPFFFFFHLKQHLLVTHYVPGTLQGNRDILINKAKSVLPQS